MRFKLFACAFLMTVLAFAAEGEWFTDGSLNGRGWKAIPIESRNSYLFGFCDAIHVEAKEKYHYYTTGKNTYTELRELLDQFYANAANTLIPVHAALVFVNLKVIGEEQSKIDDIVAMARALALIRRLDPIHAPATTSLFVDPVPTPAGPPHVNPVRFRARRLANPARAQGGEMMLLTPQRQSELFKSAEVRSAKAKKEAKTKA